MGFSASRQGCAKAQREFCRRSGAPSRLRWEGKRKLTEPSRECPMASARRNLKGSLRRHGLGNPENPRFLSHPARSGSPASLFWCWNPSGSVALRGPHIQRAVDPASGFLLFLLRLFLVSLRPHGPISPPRIISQLKAPVMRSPCAQCASLSFTSPVSSASSSDLAYPLQVPGSTSAVETESPTRTAS